MESGVLLHNLTSPHPTSTPNPLAMFPLADSNMDFDLSFASLFNGSYFGLTTETSGHFDNSSVRSSPPLDTTLLSLLSDNSLTPSYHGGRTVNARFRLVALVINAVISSLALVGNVVFCVVTIRSPRLNSITNRFMIHLCLANILFVTVSFPIYLSRHFFDSTWNWGTIACKASSSIVYVTVTATFYMMMVVALDRTRSVRSVSRPTAPHRCLRYVPAVIWLFSFGIALPYIVFYTVETVKNSDLNSIFDTDMGIVRAAKKYGSFDFIVNTTAETSIFVQNATDAGTNQTGTTSTDGIEDSTLDKVMSQLLGLKIFKATANDSSAELSDVITSVKHNNGGGDLFATKAPSAQKSVCKLVFPSESAHDWAQYLGLAVIIVQFVVPLTVTIPCYCYMICFLLVRQHRSNTAIQSTMRQRNLKRKVRTLVMLMLLLMIFVCCWTPLFVVVILVSFNVVPEIIKQIGTYAVYLVCHLLGLLSVCLSPFVNMMSDTFRTELTGQLQSLCCPNKSQSSDARKGGGPKSGDPEQPSSSCLGSFCDLWMQCCLGSEYGDWVTEYSCSPSTRTGDKSSRHTSSRSTAMTSCDRPGSRLRQPKSFHPRFRRVSRRRTAQAAKRQLSMRHGLGSFKRRELSKSQRDSPAKSPVTKASARQRRPPASVAFSNDAASSYLSTKRVSRILDSPLAPIAISSTSAVADSETSGRFLSVSSTASSSKYKASDVSPMADNCYVGLQHAILPNRSNLSLSTLEAVSYGGRCRYGVPTPPQALTIMPLLASKKPTNGSIDEHPLYHSADCLPLKSARKPTLVQQTVSESNHKKGRDHHNKGGNNRTCKNAKNELKPSKDHLRQSSAEGACGEEMIPLSYSLCIPNKTGSHYHLSGSEPPMHTPVGKRISLREAASCMSHPI